MTITGTAKEFPLGDVLSITTGRLVSRRHIDGVYDILNFMTQDSLFTHQLPRAMQECRPWLLAQHPDLATIDPESVNATGWEKWLSEQEQRIGVTLPVTPLPEGFHAFREPVAELVEMMGDPSKVIVVQAGDGSRASKSPSA